jgi:hypothetical protein
VLEPLREAIRALAFASAAAPAEATAAGREIARLGGESVRCVLFFGSRKTRPSTDPWSAYDFFVLIHGYPSFYHSLSEHRALARSPGLAAILNAWLPPNQISLKPVVAGGVVRAKCAVIDLERLVLETSARRSDQFCAGRLFQPVTLVFSRDAASAERALDALVGAHRATKEWLRPSLPREFDAELLARQALLVSMAGEIRPEPGGRAQALYEAQRDYHRAVMPLLLEEWLRDGALVAARGGLFSWAQPVEDAERGRVERLFARSKLRATLRWAKYVLTFDDWLEYLVRKVRRHSGQEIELSARERRWPLLFLWPRVFRYLRSKGR